ncbi:primase-helicase family protein [Parendozoicomonas haliclonae]|uniref:NrS-1 polymerase-like helicase domain-containing protein n=1 Tax=Parendozoicomonas haliclonae TaxID=1960125 RepID=A0A1X7AER4_9GAMM|nr:primase-helicase family protein [Parendozoicomonas haliclonae]SMA33602.1 hypothetical protein EHSB41UT_00304 [Parendozoicomonas haliclonae]
MNKDKLTFLSAKGRPLVKNIYPDKVENYPLVKRVTSHTDEVEVSPEGLRRKLEIYREHADSGNCLLIGALQRDLKNESRKGLGEKMAETHSLILDIDGIHLPDLGLSEPATVADMRTVAERIVSQLPDPFHGVSYIGHPSAKMGIKADEVRMHIEFWIDKPQLPQVRQSFLKHLNFISDLFKGQINLSASGTALSYPIDPCVGQNSRTLFIAPPVFHDVDDPIEPEARLFLVEKGKHTVAVKDLMLAFEKQELSKLEDKKLESMREVHGLPRRSKKSVRAMMDVNGEVCYVSTNPAKASVTVVADEGDFVRVNVNNGDSGAYYVRKNRPEIVWNFKGEQPFSFKDADEDAYAHFLNTFPPEFDEDSSADEYTKPLVFRDKIGDSYHTGLIDMRDGGSVIEMHQTGKREVLGDWMTQFGGLMPEIVPSWEYSFKPTDDRVLDEKNYFLNKFSLPPMLRNPVEIPAEYMGLEYGEGMKFKELCPTIFKVIYSVIGESEQEFKHFINWLAFIAQKRKMTQTVWVFQGVNGTGKGVLFKQIIEPMFSRNYSVMLLLENIEDQFNAWRETCLICGIDEVKFPDGKAGDAVQNKLKNYTTEESGVVRAMRENHKKVEFYTNYMMFLNVHDGVKLENTDRRYNIAPRQETPIRQQEGGMEVVDAIASGVIAEELPRFASMLMSMCVDAKKVTEVIDNEAKNNMREASQTSVDEFVNAINEGDLNYFSQVLDQHPKGMNDDYTRAAHNHLKAWIRDFDPAKKQRIFVDEFRSIYNVLIGKAENPVKFGKILKHYGIIAKGVKRDGVNRNGLEINFNMKGNTIDDLRAKYLTELEMRMCPDEDAKVRHAAALSSGTQH